MSSRLRAAVRSSSSRVSSPMWALAASTLAPSGVILACRRGGRPAWGVYLDPEMLRLGNASALASEALFVEAAARSPASLFEVFAGRPYPFLLESATPGPRLAPLLDPWR